MYAISLTTIPPRFDRLGPVLASLVMQRPEPVAVYLCVPDAWHRFPGEGWAVDALDGVTILRSKEDFGPATKAIVAARRIVGQVPRLIYCDDDWIYPPGWAAALLSAGSEGEAVAASGFSVARLKRCSGVSMNSTTHVDIAQGFGGVSVKPEWVAGAEAVPPPEARNADDIWLSGQLARQGIPICLCPTAREGLRPAFDDDHGLQDVDLPDQTRIASNRAALEELTRRYSLWPAMSPGFD